MARSVCPGCGYAAPAGGIPLDRGWAGDEVRSFHQRMGPPDGGWPELHRPESAGGVTVGDVVASGARAGSVEGHAGAVGRWAAAVWGAWREHQPAVIARAERLGAESRGG